MALGRYATGQQSVLVDSGTVVDLFVSAGQSNAEGRGSSASSPVVTNGVFLSSAGSFTSPMADPVGGAATGSMWPAFSNEWFALTGRNSVFIDCATGGTELVDNGNKPDWSPTGTLREEAVTAILSAVASIRLSASYKLGNVYIVWCQGESDAQVGNSAVVTRAIYKQALIDLAEYFKSHISNMKGMYVIRTGRMAGGSAVEQDWQDIRLAQEDACAESDLLTMVYRGTGSWTALSYMADELHYNQTALNITGKCAARGVYSPAAETLAPVYLSGVDYPVSATTAVSTRTVSHTTTASTTFLVVAVSSARLATNTTYTISSLTFNGVAMKEAQEVNAGNGTNACRCNVAIYYIDEATYGGSLSNVTANLVLTTSNTGNVSDMCAINCSGDGYIDSAASATITGGATGTGVSTSITTNGTTTIVVNAVIGVGASAAAIPATVGGATEIMDHGISNGTRSGNFVVSVKENTSPITTSAISTTFNSTMYAVANSCVAFRGKISGE